LWFVPGAKKLGTKSGARYEVYSKATTVRMYLALAADKAYRGKDFHYDMTHGLCLVVPDQPMPGLVAVTRGEDWRAAQRVATDLTAMQWDRVVAEQTELARLDTLEERPLPAFSQDPLPSYRPGPPSTYSAAYGRAALVYSAALAEAVEEAPHEEGLAELPSAQPSPAYVFAVTSDVRSTAGLPPPETVREARMRPDFEAPFGWKAAMAKEVKRVESFKAWTLVPFSRYRHALRVHDCTSIAYIVGAFTHKLDPDGDPRAPGILDKFRVTCADVCQTEVDPLDTYSSCVNSITNRAVTSIAPRLSAHQTTI
jgi:hypothetical protein